MIDRLVLLLLVGGCLLFGAILIMELAPAGAEDGVVAQAARSNAVSPTTRPQNPRPEELVATTLARPLFSSTRRPGNRRSANPAGEGRPRRPPAGRAFPCRARRRRLRSRLPVCLSFLPARYRGRRGCGSSGNGDLATPHSASRRCRSARRAGLLSAAAS